jgi:hypothetical protein
MSCSPPPTGYGAGFILEDCISCNFNHVTIYFTADGIQIPRDKRIEGPRLTNSDAIWCRAGLNILPTASPRKSLQIVATGCHFSVQQFGVAMSQVKGAQIANCYFLRTPETVSTENVIFVQAGDGAQYLQIHDNFCDNVSGLTPNQCYGVVFQNAVTNSQVHGNLGNSLVVGAWDQGNNPSNTMQGFGGDVQTPLHTAGA